MSEIEVIQAQYTKIIESLLTTSKMSTGIDLLKQDMNNRVTKADFEKSLGILRTKIAVSVILSNIVLAAITALIVKTIGV